MQLGATGLRMPTPYGCHSPCPHSAAALRTSLLQARNVPEAQCDVTTFYEGHVIDNINATFYTGAGAARLLPGSRQLLDSLGGLLPACRHAASWCLVFASTNAWRSLPAPPCRCAAPCSRLGRVC